MEKEKFENELASLTGFDGKYAGFPSVITFEEKKDGLSLVFDHMPGNTNEILYRDLLVEMLKTEDGKKQLAIAISKIQYK